MYVGMYTSESKVFEPLGAVLSVSKGATINAWKICTTILADGNVCDASAHNLRHIGRDFVVIDMFVFNRSYQSGL